MLIKFTSRFINKKVKIVEKNKKNCSIRLIDSTLSNKILNFKPKIPIEHGILKILKT